MVFRQGPSFDRAAPAEVIDFLRSRRRRVFRLAPDDVNIAHDGSELYVQVLQGGVKDFPVRETFLLKLLKWYGFPARHLPRLTIDTVSSLLNDFLLAIKSREVSLVIENGDALTLTSDRYSEIGDLEILDAVSRYGISGVSRNDFFLRVYTDVRWRAEPVAGDECGIGFNVFNSETGFRALTVGFYLLRYLCSNGAIIRSEEKTESRKHYGWTGGELRQFLMMEMQRAPEMAAKVFEAVASSASRRAGMRLDEVLRRLSRISGRKLAEEALRQIGSESSQYDLANAVTFFAQRLDVGRRMQAEILGGEVFTVEGPQ
jgi:hypothetical protein